MSNLLKLILIFVSLSIFSSASINTGTLIYDFLNSNPQTITPLTTSSFNAFGTNEMLLPAPVDTAKSWTLLPDSEYGTGFYTLFSTFTEIDALSNQIVDFYVEIRCHNPLKTDNILIKVQLADYQIQEVDFISATKGAAPELTRRDFIKTVTFKNTVGCSNINGDTLILELYVQNQLNQNHSFYIKQLALYANKCHPYCEECSDSPATVDSCETCTSSYTKKSDGTCQCKRNPPSLGVIALNPIINKTSFRYHCQRIDATVNLPCTSWVDPEVYQKNPFDYCSKCGGLSQEAQYLTLPFTYSQESIPNMENPKLRQNICLCPPGTSAHFLISKFQCLTPEQRTCAVSGYDKNLDTATIFAYLANIADNLEIHLSSVNDTALGQFYELSFQVKIAISIPTLLNYKVYYTFQGKQVEINIGADPTQKYSIRIKHTNLNKIPECSFDTLSNGAKLWKCKIHVVPYHPCTNLAYMNAYIPIEIGDGLVASDHMRQILTNFLATELNIPCSTNTQCFINSDFSTNLVHCADQHCATARTTTYANGETVWVKPVHTPTIAGTYKQSLAFAYFYFYDSSKKLVATINMIGKESTGLDDTSAEIFGFPIEITGEIESLGVLDSGTVALTVVFKLDPVRLLTMEDSYQVSITAPVSLQIKIRHKPSRTALSSVLIAVLIAIGAGIFGVVVYLLLKKKKTEEKKLELKLKPQEGKFSIIDHGSTSLCTGREHKLPGEEQRL